MGTIGSYPRAVIDGSAFVAGMLVFLAALAFAVVMGGGFCVAIRRGVATERRRTPPG
jgi:hypothetical protein